ncbi:MAG: mechanosensitive ion channel protein MscS [Flavobacteriales bacterium]|nr:MAG: mechanosensitive ion channel protein MscS [Flavobacteriales bacterium]
MEYNMKTPKDFIQGLSDTIHLFFSELFSDDMALVMQIILKLLVLAVLMLGFDFVLKKIMNFSYYLFSKKVKNPFLEALNRCQVFNSVAHLITLGLANIIISPLFHQHSNMLVYTIEIVFYLFTVYIVWILFKRVLKSINYFYEHKQDFYKITAIRAITQSLNIVAMIVFLMVGIQVIFNIDAKTILGSIGAMTAIILLIFRDTILGFVTGIHVSTSKNMKVGDWIAIPKYNIQGTIQEISLLTTKIINFDKTISTIPTYDLLSTEIKNNQVMSESNTRRIKRSITFNIDSFKFLNEQEIKKLMEINLLRDYLAYKMKIIQEEKNTVLHSDNIMNGQQLTNIGVFRKYVYKYLETNPKINEKETIVVRHLQASSQGLPLEIYCFANESALKGYEEIQADIFDHLLTVAKEFELDILQFGFKV